MSVYIRRSRATADRSAAEFNLLHNQVRHRIECGEFLLDVLVNRFAGDEAAFRIWCRRELDASPQSVMRYIELARHKDQIPSSAICLVDIYRELGLDTQPAD